MLTVKPGLLGGRLGTIRSHHRVVAFMAMLALAVLLGAAAVAVVLLSTLMPVPYLEANVEGPTADWAPSQVPIVVVPNLGKPLAAVTLFEVGYDANGREQERAVPTSLDSADSATGLTLWTKLQLLAPDGTSALAYDGDYRLSLAVTTLVPKLPLPRLETVTADYRFRTPAAPHPIMSEKVVPLRYGEPVQIRWDAPVEGFAVELVPPAASRTWLNPADRRVGYVALADPQPGARYQVRVTEAWGANGAPQLAPATVTVDVPAPPKLAADKVRLEDGRRIALSWDQPVASFTYELSPATAGKAEVDRSDPRTTHIALERPVQGQDYEVRITGAVGTSGAPLTEVPAPFVVTIPPPLTVVKLSPRGTEIGVERGRPISIKFSAPVADRAAAVAAVTLNPALAGRFEWPEPDRLQFTPEASLPPLTRINVLIAGGPGGVKSADGFYLDEDYEYSFLTQPDGYIDVDLTRQRLTLFEAGNPVYSTLVATGVRGAETPTGRFMVTIKWPTVRMQGVNPSGTVYDIPNVPWVMSFLGDYTLHGAPWRSRFGIPGSNGCVSMETSAAKYVYDWTPLGTPVVIHH
ncbi:MAG: L,D-transpeptidase [Dehalococcoidales bacterium]|nr:L,D-transpeptidase [Dehalococcoidales bacterium]